MLDDPLDTFLEAADKIAEGRKAGQIHTDLLKLAWESLNLIIDDVNAAYAGQAVVSPGIISFRGRPAFQVTIHGLRPL